MERLILLCQNQQGYENLKQLLQKQILMVLLSAQSRFKLIEKLIPMAHLHFAGY